MRPDADLKLECVEDKRSRNLYQIWVLRVSRAFRVLRGFKVSIDFLGLGSLRVFRCNLRFASSLNTYRATIPLSNGDETVQFRTGFLV